MHLLPTKTAKILCLKTQSLTLKNKPSSVHKCKKWMILIHKLSTIRTVEIQKTLTRKCWPVSSSNIINSNKCKSNMLLRMLLSRWWISSIMKKTIISSWTKSSQLNTYSIWNSNMLTSSFKKTKSKKITNFSSNNAELRTNRDLIKINNKKMMMCKYKIPTRRSAHR